MSEVTTLSTDDETLTEDAALHLLSNGFTVFITRPACIAFTLLNGATLTYWRSERDAGDSWDLEVPRRGPDDGVQALIDALATIAYCEPPDIRAVAREALAALSPTTESETSDA